MRHHVWPKFLIAPAITKRPHLSMSHSYLEFSHKLTFQQLVVSLQGRLIAAFLVPESAEPEKVDAQTMDLSLNVRGLSLLSADLRLDAQLLLCEDRVLVGHQFNLCRLLVVLLTQTHLPTSTV